MVLQFFDTHEFLQEYTIKSEKLANFTEFLHKEFIYKGKVILFFTFNRIAKI